MAVGQQKVELPTHDQREEIRLEDEGQAAQLRENPLDLDDTPVLAMRQFQQPFGGPAARSELYPHQRVGHPRFARMAWQRLAEFVKRPQPGFQRVLEAILRYPPLEPQEGESGTVGALASLMNAINHAMAEIGADYVQMPATPEKVWNAIAKARNGKG